MRCAPPRTGDTAPQLRLPTVDGQSFDLAANRDNMFSCRFSHAG